MVGNRQSSATDDNQRVLDISTPQPEIPGFTLDRLIGEGGFGQVWHARRAADATVVAIKVLHLELVRSIDALTRFQRELDDTARLEHPNVVRALGHGTLDDGRPFLVTEKIGVDHSAALTHFACWSVWRLRPFWLLIQSQLIEPRGLGMVGIFF